MICPKGCKDENGNAVERRVYTVTKGSYINRRQRVCPVCGDVTETVELDREILDIFYDRQRRFHEEHIMETA